MKNNLLIQTLKLLDRKQVTRFSEFATSPYFNKHKDVVNLVAYLSKIYPKFPDKKCERNSVYQVLYPSIPHDQKKLAIVFTYSLRLLEDFFMVEQAKSDGILTNKSLLTKHLLKFGFLDLLNSKWKEIINGVNNQNDNHNSVSAKNLFLLDQFTELDAAATRLSKDGHHFLETKQVAIDAYYIAEKLKDACELLQRSKVLKREYTPSALFVKSLELIESGAFDFSSNHPTEIYYRIFKLLNSNGVEGYDSLKKIVTEQERFLQKNELQIIYNYLQNFCIGQINVGNSDFLKELLDIYKSQLKQGLLIANGYLPEWHFKNIVTTGLRLNEHKWVKSFIEDYRSSLQPGVRENAYSYNLAAFYYHLKRYEDVLELLVQVEYTDLRYNLDAKSLLLRTYYDLEEEEALLALTDAFRQYLKRNRSLTDFQKKGYYNLLKFTRSAFRLKLNKDFTKHEKWLQDFKKLQGKVAEAETIFNQSWIERKLDNLAVGSRQ